MSVCDANAAVKHLNGSMIVTRGMVHCKAAV